MSLSLKDGEYAVDVDDLSKRFEWPEYLVFAAVLAASAAIGIFYGCFGSKQQTNEEFLMANRKMSAFPVALSLLCSFISANTMIGNPVEIYYYGTQYMLSLLCYIPLTLTLVYLYVPVYFNLQLMSAYEYFELRFSKTVRQTLSVISIFYLVFFMAIAVYGPALALSQVTGFHHRYLTAAIFLVCIFYSSLGGLKAVVWTDTLQALIMMASLVVIVAKGASDVGGWGIVMERARNSNRTEVFNFDPDPRTRHTVWTSIIGMYFVWLPLYAATQANIQRFVAMPDIKTVRKALLINMVGLYITIGLCFTTGLVIYAKYYDCDPVTKKTVSTADQLLPLFVMDVLGEYPALPGIFVAGITSASLSSVSSGLNALAAIITEDYIKKWKPNVEDSTLSRMSKIISVVSGLLSFGFIFAAEQMGNIFSAGVSILGMVLGPMLGIFSLGMFFPWANTKGALLGVFCSFALIGFIGIGSSIAQNKGLLPDQKLFLSTDGCFNSTTGFLSTSTTSPSSSILNTLISSHSNIHNKDFSNNWKDNGDSNLIKMLSISYIWNSMYGSLSAMIFGMIFSLIFGRIEGFTPVDKKYLSPPLITLWYKLCPKQLKSVLKSETQSNGEAEQVKLDFYTENKGKV